MQFTNLIFILLAICFAIMFAGCKPTRADANGLPHNISQFETENRFGNPITCYVLHNEANYNRAISISCVK